MSERTNRRDFLKTAAVLPAALAAELPSTAGASLSSHAGESPVEVAGQYALQPFDYDDVRLGASRWRDQFESARDFYFGVANDDILHGYRKAAGLPAPGKPLGGWARENSDIVFGQWLSGMARIYRATGDTAMRDKASYLLTEWARTIGSDGDCRMSLYSYDKLLCGLIDQHIYAGNSAAIPLIEKTMEWAMRTFSKERTPGGPDLLNGNPSEWYTLGENVYRAYELTGNEKYREFADSYQYPAFWDQFAESKAPASAYHVHAYSHVNTFSSVAMAYRISGDPKFLHILENAYDYLQNAQCYATGGFGPCERLVPPDGTLGRSLEARNATFETVCGSWAGFKMARYLTCLTGEARFGDWMERLFYNAVGAALPIEDDGKHFYYSDYRVTGGMKVYKVSRYACCSGTYIQCLADYHNLIYYRSGKGLYVNLYLPSEVTWRRGAGDVTVIQETAYPEAELCTLRLRMDKASSFAVNLRIPAWAEGAEITVNGRKVSSAPEPGTWATVDREWKDGDRIELRLPLALKMLPVDPQHPTRVAVVRGPAALAMDDWVFEDIPRLPDPKQVGDWLVEDPKDPGTFRIVPPDGAVVQAKFRPFYRFGEVVPYRVYHDLDALPIPMW
jgi:hypothetical protein